MCAGKLQAIFCGFDKGERGQIPGHKASGRALYGRRAFVHCQLPLEWHAPIASAALRNGTPLTTRHCRSGMPLPAQCCRLQAGVKTVKTKSFVIARARCAVAISGRQLRFCRKYPIIRRVLRDSHVASFLGMTRQGGAAVHQCSYAVESLCTRRSLSAATGFIDTRYESQALHRERHAAPLHWPVRPTNPVR